MSAPDIDRESIINAAHRAWKSTVIDGGSAEKATNTAVTVALDTFEEAYAASVEDGIASLTSRVAELETENARLRAALIEIADQTRNCAHDGGFDREIGPVGCLLGDKCLCIGIHPIARAALSNGRDGNG